MNQRWYTDDRLHYVYSIKTIFTKSATSHFLFLCDFTSLTFNSHCYFYTTFEPCNDPGSNIRRHNEIICLWCEVRQQSLAIPLIFPLLRGTQLSCVLLQYGCHHGDMLGMLRGHGRKDGTLVILHLWNYIINTRDPKCNIIQYLHSWCSSQERF